MRFTDVLGRSERSELDHVEAAELLGISELSFRRRRDRHPEAGLEGLTGRGLAPLLCHAPVVEIERMLGLQRAIYRSFTGKHFQQRPPYTMVYRDNLNLRVQPEIDQPVPA